MVGMEPQARIMGVGAVAVLEQLALTQQELQAVMVVMERHHPSPGLLSLTQVEEVVEPIKVEPLERVEQAGVAMAAQQAQTAPELLEMQTQAVVVAVLLFKVLLLQDRQAAQVLSLSNTQHPHNLYSYSNPQQAGLVLQA